MCPKKIFFFFQIIKIYGRIILSRIFCYSETSEHFVQPHSERNKCCLENFLGVNQTFLPLLKKKTQDDKDYSCHVTAVKPYRFIMYIKLVILH